MHAVDSVKLNHLLKGACLKKIPVPSSISEVIDYVKNIDKIDKQVCAFVFEKE